MVNIKLCNSVFSYVLDPLVSELSGTPKALSNELGVLWLLLPINALNIIPIWAFKLYC